MATWWLEEYPAAIESREHAFRAYRQRNEQAGAARMAVWLANDYADFRGELAVANGWLRRAERILGGTPLDPEHAWLAYTKAHFALMVHRDPVEARRWSAEAARLSRDVGPADMEMLGVALEGLAMVTEGQVSDGMGRLDEASAAITSGELSDPVIMGAACCYLIRACEQVRDYDRAAQWCERVREFCHRWNFTALFSSCRIQYASLLTWHGDWKQAETEIEALRRHVEKVQPRLLPVAQTRLGELRRRQGHWNEAEQLFARAGAHHQAVLGRAELALDRSDATSAAELAEEYLRRMAPQNRTERVPGLEVLVRARAATGDPLLAEIHLTELRDLAETVASDPLRAAAAFAEGVLRAPYETSRSRFHLARTLLALGRRDSAAIEARAALACFEQLGAQRGAAEARELLGPIGEKPRTRLSRETGGQALTSRELEVLRLVAQGMGDKEAAAHLGLSEHTIHRHITNILTKTGLRSRAAAVAYGPKRAALTSMAGTGHAEPLPTRELFRRSRTPRTAVA